MTSMCPIAMTKQRLRNSGLRPTRQRMELGWLIFAKGNRHLTAEILFDEANKSRLRISLATIYNTLHHFTDAGLLRRVAPDGVRTYFDTNISHHHHFYNEDRNELIDIPEGVSIGALPQVPENMIVEGIDVIVRLKEITCS